MSAFRDQVDQLGFEIFSGIFSDEEVAHLLDRLAHTAVNRSRAGIRHAMHIPAVSATASDPRLQGIASRVLGGLASPYRATLFDKSPESNWLVVWHQDTALPLHEQEHRPGWGPWSVKDGIHYAHAPAEALGQVVALRLHLDDSTEENGPLRGLPNTHTQGVLTDDAIHDLAATISPVDCHVQRGGVLAMRPLLVHASSKSQSQRPRRVLHIEYVSTGALETLGLAVA